MTREQLVRAVIADPDANASREAFAAWGVAHNDPQGELTQLQLAEVQERRVGTDRDAARLSVQASALIEKHGTTWAREVLAIASQPQFFRGFVEAVTIDVPTFLARASELYAIAPIRSVAFVDAGPHIEALAASPHLARLVSIYFYNKSETAPLGDSGLRTLIASPYLSKVVILHLAWNEIGIEGVEALAASRAFPNLRYVTLGNNHVDDPTETFGIDGMSGLIVNESIALPPLGKVLEAKYGKLRWLHGVSEFPRFPPDLHDI